MAGLDAGVASGMRDVEYVLCNECGYERRADEFVDCMFCAMRSERLALVMEVGQLREEVRGLRSDLGRVREEVGSIRQSGSVRPKDRSEVGEDWPVVGEVRRGEDSDRNRVGGEGKDSGKLTIRRVDSSQEWRVVSRRGLGKGSPAASSKAPVSCSNRFSLLEGVEGGMDEVVEVPVAESERARVDDRKSVKDSPDVLVIGDSLTRYLDRTFCEKERKKRVRVCFPGAGVNDVAERYERLVKGAARDSVVVLHVGTNDVDRVRSEELVARFRSMLEKVRESGRRCVVSGILPRCQVGSGWHSRAIGVNERVRKMCEKMGMFFMDEWCEFYGRKDLFAMDGVHLSRKGVKMMSECLEKAVKGCVVGR